MDFDSIDHLSARIAALRHELDTVAADMDRARGVTPQVAEAAVPSDVSLVATARRIIASRTMIGDIFDAALFADPATNIMLQLYIDGEENRITTSGACCAAARVPRTSALRLISLLGGRGMIATYDMPGDRRSTRVQLTPLGAERVGTLLRQFRDLFYHEGQRPD